MLSWTLHIRCCWLYQLNTNGKKTSRTICFKEPNLYSYKSYFYHDLEACDTVLLDLHSSLTVIS